MIKNTRCGRPSIKDMDSDDGLKYYLKDERSIQSFKFNLNELQDELEIAKSPNEQLILIKNFLKNSSSQQYLD